MKVTFRYQDGTSETFDCSLGDTLMDVALDNGVRGILAQCGGGCTCCTCHCWVDDDWFDRLNPLRAEEDELLSYAWGRRTNSRLSCQIRLNEDLDGLSVEVPENQG